MARESIKYGIRINSILAEPIENPIYDKLGIYGRKKEEYMARVTAGVPQGRFGLVAEKAPMALFLASEKPACSITGADFSMYGGYGV